MPAKKSELVGVVESSRATYAVGAAFGVTSRTAASGKGRDDARANDDSANQVYSGDVYFPGAIVKGTAREEERSRCAGSVRIAAFHTTPSAC